jgi:hypothetical protein
MWTPGAGYVGGRRKEERGRRKKKKEKEGKKEKKEKNMENFANLKFVGRKINDNS